MAQSFTASRMWNRIHDLWGEEAAADLSDFKSDTRNYKISLWDPRVNGVRYLKALIYNYGTQLGPDDWARIRKIENRETGNPVSVRINGEMLCMDYLQGVLELGFIEKEVDLRGGSVMEIGAGYGRTCHTIMSNHDLAAYYIVDLEKTLQLSRKYLGLVLPPEQFEKITFVRADDSVESVYSAIGAAHFDLCINVHSMAEMPEETVRAYLELIDTKCSAFFVKNPVGKFLDKNLDGHPEGQEAVDLALEAGPLRQVLDIYDSEAVDAAVPGYITTYTPGDGWTCVADGRGLPWSYFWQVIYKNERTGR
ncbi:putative sugar O-methyltransferase [Streptomyces reniochalinae]|uniref:Putative sugar O-methyltransferase n=1 Tax=Streptomyces reniochalinae TaxID=2250578 RepID=A0A367ECQ3_9ACTN|nr:putative sugar O-methyltransferase [Streptomyces reniochalinae]RCG15743.1 putative sugar O-methyltransferase [Streptomyces reniochalinae]